MRHVAMLGAAVVIGATLALPSQAVASIDRLVIALSPPTAETNRFWATAGLLGLQMSMQMLASNDPITGEYDTGGLAESWEHNDDFTKWTFHLRQGVPFHFGYGEVTAEDVVHSYELHTGEDSLIAGIGILRGAELEIVDDHTVTFHLPDPRPDFLFAHGERGMMFIYSKAQYEAEGLDGYDRRPAGTGAWQYVERRMGEGILFERVEDHWSGRDVEFAELELRWTAEPSTKLALLLSGEAHIADLPPELQPDVLDAGLEIIASSRPAMQTTFLFSGLYCTSGDPACRPDLPWADVRVREAMNRALDRQEMIDILYQGRGDRLVVYTMAAHHEGYVPELAERIDADYGYDPQRARELLAEAGYPDAFPDPVVPIVSTTLAGSPEWPTTAELLQVFFEAIGLQTEIREMDWASVGALGRGRQAYLLHPSRNAPIRPSEVGLRNFFTNHGTPWAGFEDDTMQALVEELGETVDPDERDRIARAAFTHLFEQYSHIPVAAIRAELVANPAVVAGWTFPGVSSTGPSHWHLIEAVR